MIQLVLLPVAGFDGISGEVVMQKRKFYIQRKRDKQTGTPGLMISVEV